MSLGVDEKRRRNRIACKKWRDKNKKYEADRQRRWINENRNHVNNRQLEYKKKNPDRVSKWKPLSPEQKLLYSARARAKKRGLEFSITLEDVKIPDVCPVFKTPFTSGARDYSPSIDRVDNDRGYTADNIMIISTKANRSKSNLTPEELKNFCEFFLGKE